MHPYLFEIPLPFGLRYPAASYGFMIVCGFLVSLWLVQRRGRRMGLDPVVLFDMAVLALLGGIVGARLYYVVDHWGSFASEPLSILLLNKGGMAFFGGLLGGGLAVLFKARQKHVPLLPTLDVTTSVVPLAHAFGRMGCFLAGCCFGKPTQGWSGVCFPPGSPAVVHQVQEHLIADVTERSLPVHPTQLYEMAFNLVLFAFLSHVLWKRRRPGDIAWAYAIGYGLWRFVNEFFRADTAPIPGLEPLDGFHVLAALVAIGGAIMLARSVRKPPVPLPDPWQPPEQEKAP